MGKKLGGIYLLYCINVLEFGPVAVEEVRGVAGGAVGLDCDVAHPPDDQLFLLLWFRDTLTTPIYRLDVRGEREREWLDPRQVGSGAGLEVGPGAATLRVGPLTPAHRGLYTCRADFRLQPTKTTRVNLTIIGDPRPLVWWYLNSHLLDDEMESEERNYMLRDFNETMDISAVPLEPYNTVTLGPLARYHLLQPLSCRASNSNLTLPTSLTLTLDLNYPPKASCSFGASLDVANIKEGDDVYFECAIDANPRAHLVTWRHNTNRYKRGDKEREDKQCGDKERAEKERGDMEQGERLEHNITAGVIVSNQSLVLQQVMRAQAGRYSCQATNTMGLGSSNSLRLDVKYKSQTPRGDEEAAAGLEWEGVEWSGKDWNGVGRIGMEWGGVGWSVMEWDRVGWSGKEWDGVGWSGMEWDGVGWSGMEWDGVGRSGVEWEGVG
ncbi:hypothetical protein Pcinc_043015 [Petrolisthes cinctipes]|uniref:Ig-like domain-containing protein n=1 Tax=Petrolisthes cinctipes TaxID=88211 RepID=A0AAE1BGD0_PETCI|nr:hypothetical protein Pcinc_043015 [Petrolisthes cinctipes]